MKFPGLLFGIIVIFLITFLSCRNAKKAQVRWLKGNLHTHSLWSDGDHFPEMIIKWYKDHGYQFIGLSDHNIFQEGEKWVSAPTESPKYWAYEAYLESFGTNWVETRYEDSLLEVKLKTYEQYRNTLEVPDSFLIIRCEEITSSFDRKPLHINASNITAKIDPIRGNSVPEVLQQTLDAVFQQRIQSGQKIMAHINHPNFGWGITLDDLRPLNRNRFFEVYNGHPAVNNYGDSSHLSTEMIWDLLNIHYLQNGKDLLLGIATDDAHNYHQQGPQYSNAGRGWVMVKQDTLQGNPIVSALEAASFYASTGVELEDISIDEHYYQIKIVSNPKATHYTQFIGVIKGESEPKILKETKGPIAEYRFQGNELFVRAKVISDQLQDNPFKSGDTHIAWTQPVKVTP